MKMPFRCNIIKHLMDNEAGLTPAQLFEKLNNGYPGEKQCDPTQIDKQLMSMKNVGLVRVAKAQILLDDSLEVIYAMTEYGIERAWKYIPELLKK